MPRAFYLATVSIVVSIQANAETPTEGLQAITNLYKAREFKTLVEERYSELDRFGRTEEIVMKVTESFKKRYSNDELLKKAVSFYESALKATPTVEKMDHHQEGETGRVAKFNATLNGREVELKLYEMKSRLWGFHL